MDARGGVCSLGEESQKRQEDTQGQLGRKGVQRTAGSLAGAAGRVAPGGGALCGEVWAGLPSNLLLAASALRNKCPLGLCFLCNILAFDTRCQAVSKRSLGRILQTQVDVDSGFPVSGFGPPRRCECLESFVALCSLE